MYHRQALRSRRKLVFVVLAALLVAFAVIPPNLLAYTGAAPPVPKNDGETDSQERVWLPPPAVSRLRKKPEKAEIYELDREPLGDREPLLMIHGLRGEYRWLFRWDRVVKRFKDFPDFNRHYKIYFLRYDSTAPLSQTVPQFQAGVISLAKASHGKPISVMALSLGGNLARMGMSDPEVERDIRLVFSLGTPFHGSPLFCSDWFQYSLYKNTALPWTRVDHSLDYRLYFSRNPSLLTDLSWDNADRLIPEVGRFKSLLPLGPKGNCTVARMMNSRLLKVNSQNHLDKSKFIAYAGYLVNPYLMSPLKRQIETTILCPYTFITMKIPAHLAREHPVLVMLNREIARMIPGSASGVAADGHRVYGLNDGITPVNSALFLPDGVVSQAPLVNEADLQKIRDVADVGLARVFRNIDHLTFVDGYRPRHGSCLIKDELNPQDGLRTIFDWLLSDLMQSQPLPGQLARESRTASDTIGP